MNDLEANLREAAARVGYYNERGEWVNAEWMAEAADYIDSLTAERDSAAETADIQMRFLAKAETRLAAAEQERDELRQFVKECQALAAPLGIKEALRRLKAAERMLGEIDDVLELFFGDRFLHKSDELTDEEAMSAIREDVADLWALWRKILGAQK